MKRHALVAVVAIALASHTTTATSESPNPKSTSSVKPAPACTAKVFRGFSATVWDHTRWQRGKPKAVVIRLERRELRCAGPGNRSAMKARWGRDRLSYGRYRVLRGVAPYAGGGTWWAVPYCIVAAESGGDWLAANPSGATDPYQLMPEWGAPYPATTWHQKIETHRIAGNLWADGAGASNWAETYPC